MGESTEELSTKEAEIEATRADLSRNIDELGDKVSPQRVMERRTEAVKSKFGGMRDKVMGSSSGGSRSVGSAAGSAAGSVSGAASSVGDSAQGAVHAVQSRTEGNPLAAGVAAFGLGMVISALIPASEKETAAARRTMDAAKEHGVVDEAKSVGAEVGQNLKESAKQAAEEVKSTAQDSAQTVKEEGRSSAETVRGEASSARGDSSSTSGTTGTTGTSGAWGSTPGSDSSGTSSTSSF